MYAAGMTARDSAASRGALGRRSYPEKDPPSLLAKKLLAQRLDSKSVTAEQLAKLAGTTGATISEIRHGKKRVGPDTLPGIARVLGYEIAEFSRLAELEFGHHRSAASAPDSDERREDVEAAIALARFEGVVQSEFIDAYRRSVSKQQGLVGRAILDDIIVTWRRWQNGAPLPGILDAAIDEAARSVDILVPNDRKPERRGGRSDVKRARDRPKKKGR